MYKWIKSRFKNAEDISEDRLNILFDNIQHKVNQNYFDNHYPTLFTKGYAEFGGYCFYPLINKYLLKIYNVDTEESIYVSRYANNKKNCQHNTYIEFDKENKENLDVEIIDYPFFYIH